jgi:hypothetical protein
MPVKWPVVGKSIKVAAVAIAVLGLGAILMYYKSRGVLSPIWGALLSFAYGVFALILTKKLSAYLKGESNVPILSIHINFKELAKAATCIVAMVIWIFIALSIVSNTTGGVIVLMVPCFILGTAALYFFSRSY